MLSITHIPLLKDNYAYALHNDKTGDTAVIDAGEAAGVQAFLSKKGWKLSTLLSTHHHGDHTDGNLALRAATGCQIIGHEEDKSRIPGITRTVKDGERFLLCGEEVEVIATPGHTLGQISYYIPSQQALFCGDTLFLMGCGRLFEGTAKQMLDSLMRLDELPGDTLIYCGHEYTLKNARFALDMEQENPDIRSRYEEVKALRAKGIPTVPGTLKMERHTNPFLRVHTHELQRAMKMEGADALGVFIKLREYRNSY